METILLVLHIALGLALIAIILLQQGAGATAGAAFGSGASSTVFGSRGSGSFLTRTTAVLALVFFANSFLLAYLSGQTITPKSIIDKVETAAPSGAGPATGAADIELPDLPTKSSTDDLPDMPN
jgi:preprotein translocase subunit SecG